MYFLNNIDLYPTPRPAIENMVAGLNLIGKTIYEPHFGTCAIVDYLRELGVENIIGSEIDPRLRKLAEGKLTIIGENFLEIQSQQISHVDIIILNPPFSNGADHILHAYNIAPAGCQIVALCNLETVKNPYSATRKQLQTILESYGQWSDLGECFTTAERKTNVEVALIRLQKPGENYDQEFQGFFTEEDAPEAQENGIMSYNAVRDLVNRYVESIKVYDQQLDTAVKLNYLQKDYFDLSDPDDRRGSEIAISINQGGRELARNEFKKRMQKSGWRWIFSTMNLNKYATKGLREDINKFVEKQQDIPFTMRNIYKMLEIVIGTTGQRMDKAIVEVFDKVTSHSHDNHHRLEGWKTNSHYLLTKRFIIPRYYKEEMEDMVKALCYITGDNYDSHMSLDQRTRYDYALVSNDGKVLLDYPDRPDYSHCKKVYHEYEIKNIDMVKYPECKLISLAWNYGQWFDWGFFNVRHYKKGTYHFEFKSEDLWAKFNQHVARIKGYPLMEKREQTKYQERQNGRKQAQPAYKPTAQKPTILATFKV